MWSFVKKCLRGGGGGLDNTLLGQCWPSKGSNQTKKTGFFWTLSERVGGGGGFVESKISFTEKTEIFWNIFGKMGGKGGGVSPIPKGVYHKILISFIKY